MDNHTLQQYLDQLASAGRLRSLREVSGEQGPKVTIAGREVLLLCSNNYLGIANHPSLVEASMRATREFGTSSGASRLVSGSMSLHHRLEERIAAFKGTEAALVFNSGYAANIGILQGLLGPDDVIFSDALNHASIIDGCRLSAARCVVYPHNDWQALEALMARELPNRKGHWLVVSDGVFSMDGDIAPLTELCELKQRFDAWLMVDDAHGTGVLGEQGRGSAEQCGCLAEIDLHMGTLGKALGGFGAFVATSQAVVDTLVNRSRSFIFSTSLPPGVMAAGIAAFDLVESEEGKRRRRQLEENRKLFAGMVAKAGIDILDSPTQIVPLVTHEPELTMRSAAALLEQGYFIQGIRPPTVPEGLCRLRATLMADHAPKDLTAAAEAVIALFGDSV
mgnify:CR=1 FL=1